jgi:hypothetical protein
LKKIKMHIFDLTIYAVGAFTHPPLKKLTFSPIFPDFSIFSLMVSPLHLHFLVLLVTIIICKKVSSKKNTKKRDFLFQHSILFFENGQK